MSTWVDLNTVRASALASLIAGKYKRVPFEQLAALPELRGLTPFSIAAVVDTAIGLGWIEQDEHGFVVAPSPLDREQAA